MPEEKKDFKYVAVAGNIGAGKSSLTSLLGKKFGWDTYYESVDDNPYLSDFYEDMRRWSFNLQIFFLSSRFHHHKEMLLAEKNLIQDRTIYEDVEIFAKGIEVLFEVAQYFTELEVIDLGGGFKVPYQPGEEGTDIFLLGKKVKEEFDQFEKKYNFLIMILLIFFYLDPSQEMSDHHLNF